MAEGNIGFKTDIGQAEFECHVCASTSGRKDIYLRLNYLYSMRTIVLPKFYSCQFI